MKQTIITAIDSFKGCLTSQEANQAATEGIMSKRPDAKVIQIPVSDGGEGWLEAFRYALGGDMREPDCPGSSDAAYHSPLSHQWRHSRHRNCSGQWSPAAHRRRAESNGSYQLWDGTGSLQMP